MLILMGNKFILNYCIFVMKYMDTFANLELRNVCVVNNYWKNCFNSMLCLLICLGNISYVSLALKYAQDMQKL